jgi:hypothetical protein
MEASLIVAIAALVPAFGAWLFPRVPRSSPGTPSSSGEQSPTSPTSSSSSASTEDRRGQSDIDQADAHYRLHLGPLWRELAGVIIAGIATVAVSILIAGTEWGSCGSCDDVLDFGMYPLADSFVLIACIIATRTLMIFSSSSGGRRGWRRRQLIGVLLSVLVTLGIMGLATILWRGELDISTLGYDPKMAVWRGGYSDLDPTPRTILLALVVVTLSRLSVWVGRGF